MKTYLAALALLASSSVAMAQQAPAVDNSPMVDTPKECAQWCKPYWKSQPTLEYVYFAAEAADMLTTLDIKNHPNLEEKNPILGTHPSDGKVIGWCIATALLHSALTYELVDQDVPKPIITAWEAISIGVETGFAVHNYTLGLRFKF